MSRGFNVKDNVNEAPKRSNINVNVSRRSARVKLAQRIANELVRRFKGDSGKCYNFFLKAAWRLPQSEIWAAYEAATEKKGIKSPIRYFIAIIKSHDEMR